MQILVTNDDGIDAPGLAALARVAAEFGQVHVVAPLLPQSATGHSISVLRALPATPRRVADRFDGWSVDGRPADCVKVALHALLERRPDWVLSGINCGVNTGTNVFYSGTIAAALEAAFFDVPSVAFSLELSDHMDYAAAGAIARDVFRQAIANPPGPQSCLSVNIPRLDLGPPRGIRVVRQSRLQMEDRYHRQTDPRGRPVFWLDGLLPHEPSDAATDLSGIHERYVTITPLRPDMTDFDELPRLAARQWELGGTGNADAVVAVGSRALRVVLAHQEPDGWRIGREAGSPGVPCGIAGLIEHLAVDIQDAAAGFKLLVSLFDFPGRQATLVRDQGNGAPDVYRWAERDVAGPLGRPLAECFSPPAERIFVRGEPRHGRL